ncbi:MAG: hypothetical protein O3A05_07580 [Proteobacteria bacterium]|nr:hypothetical protein [Pseudomonadota bacterium]MDA1011776.1 hypothetical protein [Pseudomonadota bacterium]
MNSVGRSIIAIENAHSQRVCAFCVSDKAGKCTIWLANLTREQQTVSLMGIPGMLVGMSISETNFKLATQHPYRLQSAWKSMEKTVTLKPYAVSILSNT